MNLKGTTLQLVSKLLTAELPRFSDDKKDVVRGFAANSQSVHTKKQYPEIKQECFNSMICCYWSGPCPQKSGSVSLDSVNVKTNQTIQRLSKANNINDS